MNNIMEFKEALIPSYIWKFVKKVIKNPITAGILAFIIWSYVKKHTSKEEQLKDLMQNNPNQFIEMLTEDNTMSNSDSLTQTKMWKDIGGEPTRGKIKRYIKGDKTAYITKSKYGKYGVGINKTLLKWFDDIKSASSYLDNIMKKESFSERLDNLYEASFDIKPFLDIANDLHSLDAVTKWVKQNHYNVHGHCQNIAALYAYVENKFTAISTSGHIAFKLGDKIYDPIYFSQVPTSVEIWQKKFPVNENKTLIKLKHKESITIPINVGDIVLGGKFKNKKTVVKSIGKNDKGEVTINDKPLMRYRIMKKEESLSEQVEIPKQKIKAWQLYKIFYTGGQHVLAKDKKELKQKLNSSTPTSYGKLQKITIV